MDTCGAEAFLENSRSEPSRGRSVEPTINIKNEKGEISHLFFSGENPTITVQNAKGPHIVVTLHKIYPGRPLGIWSVIAVLTLFIEKETFSVDQGNTLSVPVKLPEGLGEGIMEFKFVIANKDGSSTVALSRSIVISQA
jgi:hypothetical protein